MLDVRITGYVVPLAEQPQASLTPVISVENVADENAIITGLIRIYRDSTGLMIYDSRLAVTQLEHGTSANIAALTPFDPPAPADDDYFVKADLVATSYLPGPPLSVTLGAWHFDIKTPAMGSAPAGHHGTHEDGGSDEVDCTGLAGAGGAAVPAQVDVYTSDDTWTKPAGAKVVYVECVGPGGGGGGGCGDAAGTKRTGGCGAGAGSFVRRWFPAAALGATEVVTIGAGGAKGAGGAAGPGASGALGTTTKFGAVQLTGLWAYSGGPGYGATVATSKKGGGGAGSAEVGDITGDGGYPGSSTYYADGNSGAASSTTDHGGPAEYGGGSGAGEGNNPVSRTGGASLFGPAGGGSGGGVQTDEGQVAGGPGGYHGEYGYNVAGGVAGGAGGGGAGNTGTAGDGHKTNGGGGSGGGGNNGGVGGVGGDGGAPGGGGGGGAGGTNTGGDGGDGARGEVRVYTFF